MLSYALRIHKDSINEEDYIKLIEGLVGSYLIVIEEDANRTHYQGIISTEIRQETLKKRIQRSLIKSGNGAYSFKVVKDYDKYIRYLCKGSMKGEYPKVVSKSGIKLNDKDIRDLHYQYWEIKENTKDKSMNMIEFICQKLSIYESITKKCVVQEVIKYYKVNNKPMNIFHMKSQVRLIMCKLDNNYENDLVEEILRDL